MTVAGLEEGEIYVLRCRNTIAWYIATRPILELCMVAEQWPETWVARRVVIDLEGERLVVGVAELT